MCRENNSMGDIQQLYLTGMVPAGGCFVKIHSLLDGEWVAVIPALSSAWSAHRTDCETWTGLTLAYVAGASLGDTKARLSWTYFDPRLFGR